MTCANSLSRPPCSSDASHLSSRSSSEITCFLLRLINTRDAILSPRTYNDKILCHVHAFSVTRRVMCFSCPEHGTDSNPPNKPRCPETEPQTQTYLPKIPLKGKVLKRCAASASISGADMHVHRGYRGLYLVPPGSTGGNCSSPWAAVASAGGFCARV